MALRPSARHQHADGPRRRVRRLGAVALALPVILLAAGCSLLNGSDSASGSSSSSSSGASGHVEKANLTVNFMQVTDCVPFQIALQKGYFKQEGLNVTAKSVVSGTESVPKVVAGSADIGFGNWATLLTAQAKKAGDFKIVADGAQGQAGTMALTTWPGSGITKPSDLVGKTISTNAQSDLPFLALKAILQANSVDINTVHVVVVHHPNTMQALASHQVDAAIQLEPFMTQTAEKIGARPVIDLFGAGPTENLPIAGYFTTAKFAQENPKTVAAFARAMSRGAADASDRKEVEQYIPTFTKINAQTAALLKLPTYPTSLDATRLQRVADLMKTYGLLQTRMDVAPMVVVTPPAT
jgi:NitT/TauT family transport system substrate-binding protein